MNFISNNFNSYNCLIFDSLKNKLLTKQNLVIMAVALAIFAVGLYLGGKIFPSKTLPPLQPMNPGQKPPLDLLLSKNEEKKEKKVKQKDIPLIQPLNLNVPVVEPVQQPSPFTSTFRKEFKNWLEITVQKYSQQYPDIQAILNDFDAAQDEKDFNQRVDALKNQHKITGPSAYHIKKQFQNLIAAAKAKPIDLVQKQQIAGKQPKIEDAFKKAGLNLAECESAFPQISDKKRYGIRDKTKQKICDLLKVRDFKELENRLPSVSIEDLDQDLQKETKQIVLANDPSGLKGQTPSSEELLGRFDVLTVPCRMDYDAEWNERDSKQSFLVHHAAALNIGESQQAADFADYSVNGKLDLAKYQQGMGLIFRNIIAEQATSQVKHAVWFPFGMGAFLRHLPKLDKDYQDPQKMQNLRETIVHAFMTEAFKITQTSPSLQIHLCLPFDDDEKSEASQNYKAFFDLFKQAPDALKKTVQFHLNIDATDLAQRLADEEDQPYCVSLANGANRKLIGNRWFENYARVAIDENLHRRSSQLALFAALLNRSLKPSWKSGNELGEHVKQLKGQVK